jgi:hypothetical protein
VVSRHGCFRKLVVDGGPENKDHLEAITTLIVTTLTTRLASPPTVWLAT